MTAPFPHQYETSLKWKGGSSAALSGRGKAEIVGGPPSEFDGSDKWWSPEELLLQSISLCLFTTFQSLGLKKNLELVSYESRVSGVLEKTKEGLLFTHFGAELNVEVPLSQVDLANQLVASAKRYCVISNALKVNVDVKANVKGVGEKKIVGAA